MLPFVHDRISPPQIVASEDAIPWAASYDVVVVGFGGAGVVAALEALDKGAQVALVERFEPGGATAISGNVVYAGGGTRYQRQNNIFDSPENMFAYLKQEVGEVVTDHTLRAFCEGSAGMIDWLERQGVTFGGAYFPGKTALPPGLYSLYHSGNELGLRFRDQAKPAPRGHRARHPRKRRSPSSGRPDLFAPLKRAALDKGAVPYLLCEVVRLLQDVSGRVIGVEMLRLPPKSNAARRFCRYMRRARACHLSRPDKARAARQKALEIEAGAPRERVFLKARKAVILATGGFVFNRDMMAHYAPSYARGFPLGTAGCNGSGIALGQSVGGATAHMQRVSAWRFINPPQNWIRGVLVDGDGRRLDDESQYGGTLGEAICEKGQGRGYLILDADLVRATWRELWHIRNLLGRRMTGLQWLLGVVNMMFNCQKAADLAGLAGKLGIPAAALQATVDEYNQAVLKGEDDLYRKDPAHMARLQAPPYYALDMSITSSVYPMATLTLGGLVVAEESGLVLREDGRPVRGLYAVGRAAVGICSRSYVSGLSLADCVFSGRRAARHAVGAGHGNIP